jgi:hypothetical protein
MPPGPLGCRIVPALGIAVVFVLPLIQWLFGI